MTSIKPTAQSTIDPLSNATDFTAQQDIVDRLALVTEIPGAGVQAILQSVTNNSNSVPITTAEAAMKMREQLRNNSANSAIIITPQVTSAVSTNAVSQTITTDAGKSAADNKLNGSNIAISII